MVDAVHKRCDIHQPAFWQTLHILSVTETNGLGSETTTLRFRLHELRKSLLLRADVPALALLQPLLITCSCGCPGG